MDNDEAGLKFTAENVLIPCNKILTDNRVKDYNELLQLITHNRETVAKSVGEQNHGDAPSEAKPAQTVKHSRR